MSTKNTTTTMEASEEDRRRVQGIGDDDGCGSRSTPGLADLQQQQSVDFTCYRVAGSNTVSYLSRRCLVLVLFHHIPFFSRSLQKILSKLQSCRKYFCTKCTLALCMYPLRTGE